MVLKNVKLFSYKESGCEVYTFLHFFYQLFITKRVLCTQCPPLLCCLSSSAREPHWRASRHFGTHTGTGSFVPLFVEDFSTIPRKRAPTRVRKTKEVLTDVFDDVSNALEEASDICQLLGTIEYRLFQSYASPAVLASSSSPSDHFEFDSPPPEAPQTPHSISETLLQPESAPSPPQTPAELPTEPSTEQLPPPTPTGCTEPFL